MLFYIQAALAAIGSLCLVVGRVRVGDRAISRPIMTSIGGVLAAPLFLCNLFSFYSELSHAPQTHFIGTITPELDPDPLDTEILGPAVTIMALLAAGGLVVLGINTGDSPLDSLMAPASYNEAPRIGPPLPDPFAPTPKVQPREEITTSRPPVMVMASPSKRPTGNAIDPSEWDEAIGQLDAAFETTSQLQRDVYRS